METKQDLHCRNAACMFCKDPQDVTPDERAIGRLMDEAFASRLPAVKVAAQAHIPVALAEEYFGRFAMYVLGVPPTGC